MLLAAPTLLWQAAQGWPQLEVAAGLATEQGGENRALFVPLQLVLLSPLFVPLWVAGALRVWRDPLVRFARPVVPAYLLVGLATLVLGGKAYYVVPLLLVLLAAGAPVAVARVRVRWLVPTVAVAAAVSLVGALPVLPPAALGPVVALNGEQGEQVGWDSFTATVATAWELVPVADRATAVVYTTNYGEAGALDRYGSTYGMPAPYSGHMSYADWGAPPDTATGPVVLVAHERNRAANRYFTGCRHVATIDTGYDWDNGEQGIWVRLCTGTTAPWSELWPRLRHTA